MKYLLDYDEEIYGTSLLDFIKAYQGVNLIAKINGTLIQYEEYEPKSKPKKK